MSNADAQVIGMVNRPHEERAKAAQMRKAKQRRKAELRQLMLVLALRLELYILAIALLFIATAHGWVAGWLGTIAMAITLAAGAVEVGRFWEGGKRG